MPLRSTSLKLTRNNHCGDFVGISPALLCIVMHCYAFVVGGVIKILNKINSIILNDLASNQGVGGSSPSERAI